MDTTDRRDPGTARVAGPSGTRPRGPRHRQGSPVEVASRRSRPARWAATVIIGAGVAVGLGVFGVAHEPAPAIPFTLGFSGLLQMKSWLSTVVLVLAGVQLVTALWMWGRLPGTRTGSGTPRWVRPLHRTSGTVAFAVSLPVAFVCLWTLGFHYGTPRTLVHSVAGCLFYGAYVSKMIGLRLRAAPRWAIPVLGGTVFSLVVLLWLTSALWLFTNRDLPKF